MIHSRDLFIFATENTEVTEKNSNDQVSITNVGIAIWSLVIRNTLCSLWPLWLSKLLEVCFSGLG